MKHEFVVLAMAAVGAVACTEFPTIDGDTCGNQVLEPGEDCDTFADPALGDSTACAEPGAANECAYVCGDGSGALCPTGWGCGADGRCRRAGGFVDRATGSPWRFKVDHYALGDVDGDGAVDMLGANETEVVVRYGAGNGEFTVDQQIRTRRAFGPPFFGLVDDDARMDVVLPLFSGIFVMLGQAERDLQPIAYQPFEIPASTDARLVPMEAQADVLNTEVVGIFGGAIQFLNDTAPAQALPAGHTQAQLVGRVDTEDIDQARLIGDGGREEMLLAFADETRVFVMTSEGAGPTLRVTERQQVFLPGGFRVHEGANFADVDGNGHLDVMISGVNDGGQEIVAVSYADGAGNLQAIAGEELVFRSLTPSPYPLAAGDLNGDGKADYVTGDAAYITDFTLIRQVGSPRSLTPTAFRITEDRWIAATMGDYNGDGLDDAAVAVDGTDGIDFLLSTGTGLFNRFHVDSDGPPFVLRTGDFDGDLVADVAFAAAGGDDAPDSIGVAFGALSGGPTEPIDMGQLDIVASLEPVHAVTDLETIDLATDLLVVSDNFPDKDGKSVAILQGNSERRLLSPFVLQVTSGPDSGTTDVPQRVFAGNFSEMEVGGADRRDVISIAQPASNIGADGVGTPLRAFRLWMVPGDGPSASLSASQASFEELPATSEFNGRCSEWTPVDLDGDGFEEMVGFDGVSRCFGNGSSPSPQLAIARSDGTASLAVEKFAIGDDLIAPLVMKARDLDDDGDLDLLVVFAGEARSPLADQSQPADGSGVAVLWNVDGVLDLDSITSVQVPDVFRVFDADAIQLDDQVGKELVILAQGGVFVSAPEPDSLAYTVPTLLVEQAGQGAIAVADVDRDGVDDVTWTEGADIHVFLGGVAQPLGGGDGSAVTAEQTDDEEGQ